MRYKTYSEKLKDPRWQKLRLKVMERDDFTCLCCGDKTSTLNVHHLKYTGDPWESSPEHLETLCERCHVYREQLNDALKLMPTKEALNIGYLIEHDCSDFIRELGSIAFCLNRMFIVKSQEDYFYYLGLAVENVTRASGSAKQKAVERNKETIKEKRPKRKSDLPQEDLFA